MAEVLGAANLVKRYDGRVVLDHVNFSMNDGEIHCLFGENGAGKSTFSGSLYGYVTPDSGDIRFRGTNVRLSSPADAIALGIGMIHQHFKLVPRLTVLENVVIGLPDTTFFVNLRSARKRFEEVCQQYSVQINPDAIVEDLPVGQQQWIEIIKVLFLKTKVLILDEPTAVLTPQESDKLMSSLKQMRANGVGILLISHKLREVMLCDRVSILRAGKLVGTVKPACTSAEELSSLMVGEKIAPRRNGLIEARRRVVLDIRDVHAQGDRGIPVLNGVSLQVRSHEIVGLAGVSGNGQRELFESIMKLRPVQRGKILINGDDVGKYTTNSILRLGVGHVPDDRYAQGLVGEFSIADNLVIGSHRDRRFRSGLFLDRVAIAVNAAESMKKFGVVAPSCEFAVNKLSGGNAQKVILAREFGRSTSLILANQPTRGLDLKLIDYVYRQLLERRDLGLGILLASEELEDMLAICDRVAVMHRGKIVGVVDPKSSSNRELGLMMTGTRSVVGEVGVH